MRIGLVALDGGFTSGLSSLVDVLGTAEAIRPAIDAAIPAIDVDVLGDAEAVQLGGGFTVRPTRRLEDAGPLDVVVVPAFGTLDAASTIAALDGPAGRRVVGWLGAAADQPDLTLAGACTGVFALAEAGRLRGLQATTSWWLGAAFRRRYPDVDLDLDRMVVSDRATITAGAAFAHVDLALALVRRASAELADHVARTLVVDQRASQGAYVAVDRLQHEDALVRRFERYARDHLGDPTDVGQMAEAIGTSRRTLERRTRAALGMSPLALIRRLRLERASHLLRTTDLRVEEIAPQVGYANASTLRTLLREGC